MWKKKEKEERIRKEKEGEKGNRQINIKGPILKARKGRVKSIYWRIAGGGIFDLAGEGEFGFRPDK
jgi:hypothetical protein